MSEKLPLRIEEPTLGLIRELRDAEVLSEALLERASAAHRPSHTRRIDALIADPTWDDIQLITAQLATKPLFDTVPVDTKLTLGLAGAPTRKVLAHPLLVRLPPFDDAVVTELRATSELHVLVSAERAPDGEPLARCVPYDSPARLRDQRSDTSLPFGVRIGGSAVERELGVVVAAGADFVVLEAGSAAIRALADARRCLGRIAPPDGFAVILSGELRVPNDFVKALALGADGVIVGDGALASTFKLAAERAQDGRAFAANFVANTVQLMTILARACGHDRLSQFGLGDLTTWLHQVALVSGVARSGNPS